MKTTMELPLWAQMSSARLEPKNMRELNDLVKQGKAKIASLGVPPTDPNDPSLPHMRKFVLTGAFLRSRAELTPA